ncbi:hypothetical protein [Synechococcus sp. HIMB2401]|uniref:hypothetical protein n=1 Tax=Synechococcus sp. HIMB2401 TaxID=3144208 RepID=UPI0036F1A751
MKQLLIAILLLMPVPAFADLGAAEKGINSSRPGKTLFRGFFENEFKAYCEKWGQVCMVRFSKEKMTVDSGPGITPEQIERTWKLHQGVNSTVWIVYRDKDQAKKLAAFEFHGNSEFWHRLNLFMSGIQVNPYYYIID